MKSNIGVMLPIVLVALFNILLVPINAQRAAAVLNGPIGDMAKQLQSEMAPFRQTTINRLVNSVFGTTKGTRSTDVIIVNKSDYDFTQSQDPKCLSSGIWSPDPEPDIQAHSSSAYRVESKDLKTGPKGCQVTYVNKEGDAEGPRFQVTTSNPYFGAVEGKASACCGVKVSKVVGRGNNNRVRFTIINSPK